MCTIPPSLNAQNISKSFGSKEILKGIDLEIFPGELTYIVGTSGAGKTTLLNILGGLDAPSTGSVVFEGENISGDLSEFRRTKVGFIFQDYNLIPGLSVRENIELALLYAGKKNSSGKAAPAAPESTTPVPATPPTAAQSPAAPEEMDIGQLITRLGIKDADQKAETLSGGEKQRTAIVRSICKRSDLILADEPTGNLDSVNSQIVMRELVALKPGRYVVVVSHDIDMAKKFADRIITISDGRITGDERRMNEG